MPAAPTLSTAIVAGTLGHIADTNTVHGIVNNAYKTPIGTTRTAAYTLTQANSMETIQVNSTAAVVITAPVLQAGTEIRLVRIGSGAVTVTASGTTFTVPTGATPTPRVQGSVITLTWLSTTSVLISGDLAVSTGTPPGGGGGGQTLGVGGVTVPSGAITGAGNSGGLIITTSGTSTAQRVYDGGGRTIGPLEIDANYVTVQNFNIVAGGQYGAYLEGNNNTLQNCDISGVEPSGDGDLNAITAFGNNVKILYNTAINFVNGDPGDSHTDAIQTWVSTNHPTASSNWAIVGNKFWGPLNPSRDPGIASIHQVLMVEDYGRGGNSGGSTSGMSGWFIADNQFRGSWGQDIKIDGGDNFIFTRNVFTGDSDYAIDFFSGTGNKFYSDNIVGSGYGEIGVAITPGAGPATPSYV